MERAATNLLEQADLGLYTPAEAALYARAKPALVRSWFYGTEDRQPVAEPSAGTDRQRLLTFLDFMQLQTIRQLRLRKVPLPAIRGILGLAADQGVTHPFARRHTVFQIGRGDLVLRLPGEPEPVLIGARRGEVGQQHIPPVIEPHLEDVMFDSRGLAEAFVADQRGEHRIVMRPGSNFGDPTVDDTGLTAQVLYDAVQREGSTHAAAEAYGVALEQVRAAALYIDSLQTAA